MVQEIGGFKGLVTELQEARRFNLLAPPVVGGPNDQKPTSTGTRTISFAAGAMMCCGVHYSETAARTIALTANSSGTIRVDIVGLRFTWGATPSVAPFAKAGTASGPPTLQREPGVVYEVPIARVIVRNGVSTIAAGDVFDMRVWGGVGGPYSMSQMTHFDRVDLPIGAEILVSTSLFQVTGKGDNGATTLVTVVDPQTTAWKAFVPNLYNFSGQQITATTFWKDGRYRIENGVCRFKVRVAMYGTIGWWNNAGGQPYSIALPVKVGTQLTDQWAEATNMAPGTAWVPAKVLLRGGASRGLLYTTYVNGADVRVVVVGTRPEVYTIDGSYLV